MRNLAAILLAGGVGSRLNILVRHRAKPAVPFGGIYRIIDFTLSNIGNSSMTSVAVLTQYKPLSLMDHIGDGSSWDMSGRSRSVKIFPPKTGEADWDWYRGTADAVRQNIAFVNSATSDEIMILSGDHVYHMDYRDMVSFHRKKGARVTIATIPVAWEETHQFGTAVIDSPDWLEPLIWGEVCRKLDKPSIESIPYGKGYTEALPIWREFLDTLDRLRARGMATILIAHSEIKRFDAPDSDPFDRYQIKLHKGAAALVQEWADVIGFAQFETTVKKTDTGFGATRTRGIGTGRRLLHVVEKPAYVAKNRYGLPDTLPLDWNALVAGIQGTTQPEAA